jgi:hypothetical protein
VGQLVGAHRRIRDFSGSCQLDLSVFGLGTHVFPSQLIVHNPRSIGERITDAGLKLLSY